MFAFVKNLLACLSFSIPRWNFPRNWVVKKHRRTFFVVVAVVAAVADVDDVVVAAAAVVVFVSHCRHAVPQDTVFIRHLLGKFEIIGRIIKLELIIESDLISKSDCISLEHKFFRILPFTYVTKYDMT